ncbi:hypothetical protein ACFO0N_13760 [Halobium salinum]|uniref:Major facilitator superfamily (MFS) profile domain-containing protein n=1 Tax=Halobium salinum TaxID=1364940 RepID=A0ABD5PDK1_9EURY|nr:hypothetical protein [Halobium salinum]
MFGSWSVRHVGLAVLVGALVLVVLVAATTSLSSAVGVLGTVGGIAAVIGVSYLAFNALFGTEFDDGEGGD